jgi:hypothetical protein
MLRVVTAVGLVLWVTLTLGAKPLVPVLRQAVERVEFWLGLDVSREEAE